MTDKKQTGEIKTRLAVSLEHKNHPGISTTTLVLSPPEDASLSSWRRLIGAETLRSVYQIFKEQPCGRRVFYLWIVTTKRLQHNSPSSHSPSGIFSRILNILQDIPGIPGPAGGLLRFQTQIYSSAPTRHTDLSIPYTINHLNEKPTAASDPSNGRKGSEVINPCCQISTLARNITGRNGLPQDPYSTLIPFY